MVADHARLHRFIRAIVAGDEDAAATLLAASPDLAMARVERGATRQDPSEWFLDEIGHYVYQGDSALHVAAAAHRPETVRLLLAAGADVGARNRRGAQPLHYAADGGPGSSRWNPEAQAETVTCLVDAGADPNGVDKGGVTPLHRAVRNRCAGAVKALLDGGADAVRPNASGSTPIQLATWTTGRGGSGSVAAKVQQEEIVQLLEQHGAHAGDRSERA
jgi:ankyrin repeat protein